MEEGLKFKQQVKHIYRALATFVVLSAVITSTIIYVMTDPTLSLFKKTPLESDYVMSPMELDDDRVENGIHVRTGLIEAEGLMEVVYNCTNCHSSKLVIQNRMNKENWMATIRWMQETQNLADLGLNEEIIVNYLVSNYPPVKKGRRTLLSSIEWYNLED
ncbi:monoheme cytochrome C [Ulvibacter sp.]|nr:monoheme cytochrome C [Ulvibacter sp.]